MDNLAYVVGVAIGDGNLSNPNGRATRLRITCDTKYPKLISKIQNSVSQLLPKNKVSIVRRAENYIDISCYSNKWEYLLGWRAHGGPKYTQSVRIPRWIYEERALMISCLRGLIQTDGSVYSDRKYIMVNFTSIILALAEDVLYLIERIGFHAKMYKIQSDRKRPKYVIRVAKRVDEFLEITGIDKS